MIRTDVLVVFLVIQVGMVLTTYLIRRKAPHHVRGTMLQETILAIATTAMVAGLIVVFAAILAGVSHILNTLGS